MIYKPVAQLLMSRPFGDVSHVDYHVLRSCVPFPSSLTPDVADDAAPAAPCGQFQHHEDDPVSVVLQV